MTINEIAEKAGVSIGTVDRVIHKRGRVSKETVARIEKIIRDSGFRPNPLARQLALKKPLRIAVLLPKLTSDSSYWKLIYSGIMRAVEDLKLLSMETVLVEFSRDKDGDFLKKASLISTQDFDALILAPVVAEEVWKSLTLFSNIPYVFVDSPLPDGDPISTVAQDPYQGGFCAGRMMDLLSPRAKKIFCLQMHSGTYNLKERAKGFSGYFSRKKIICMTENITTKESADRFIKSVLDENPDGIFLPDNSSYRFAEYCKENGIEKSFTLVGYDLMKKNMQYLKEGLIDCLLSQQAEQQGYEAVKAIYRKVTDGNVVKNISMPITIHFKENI